MKIVIEGDPHPMARPRAVQGHVYYLSRDIEWRELIRWTCLQAMARREPFDCPLKVKVKFYRKLKPTSKNFGDCDNLLKGLFDGMNGIVFKDDSQIVKAIAEKLQDKEKPRCEVEIIPLRGQN